MAIDRTATTAYAGIRFAPRPNTRTCAQGSPAQQRYISDLVRDLHAVRVAKLSATGTPDGARWTAQDVNDAIAMLGTAEDAIREQMVRPLVYSGPTTVGTIDALKATLQRERAMLRAMQARNTASAAPAATAPQSATLEEDQTYRAADGRVIRIVRGNSGHLYGKVWTPETSSFEYFPGVRNVAGMVKMTLEEVSKFGQQTGQCCVCCTPLTDTVSIALGIGPICESRYTGKARSRSAKYRASVLAEYADRMREATPADVPVEAASDAPF